MSSDDAWPARGTDLSALRRRNLALVAQTVLRLGAPARAEIAQVTGLSATSLTKLTAQLKEARLLVELMAVAGGDTGRPRVPVALDTSYHRFLGIHIGLRRTTGGLVDLAGNVVTERVITHRRTSRSAILDEARALCDELTDEAGGADRVLGAGVATGGRVDPETGTVLHHPLLGWRDIHLGSALGQRPYPLLVDSSVRALALAESYLGVAQGAQTAVFLFIGNIVGAGLLVDGRLRRGRDSSAGTIDHLPVGGSVPGEPCHCGRHDCLAILASDVAVLGRARSAGLVGAQSSFETLVRASRSGVDAAADLLRERARHAGVAAGILIDLLDPDVLVLGGGLLQAPEHLGALADAASARLSRPEAAERILPTGLGEGTLVRGSASLPMHAFFSDPVSMLRRVPGSDERLRLG
jgi:predicted NBD/HSP70 family sugar kinase